MQTRNPTPVLIDTILLDLANKKEIITKEMFQKLKNFHYARLKLSLPLSDTAFVERYKILVTEGKIPDENRIRKLIRKRAVRSLSGISVISLLSKPWPCPGRCVYCPTFVHLPKSYVPNEPAVMRAELNEFDAFRQVQNRLRSLEMIGHGTQKCDVRIIGGSWTAYPADYREDFIRDIYDAHTLFETIEPIRSSTLKEAKTRNESALHRIIGIAIETRPDLISHKEIIDLRRYGVTRIEIGYQTTIDTINEGTKRGHGNTESIRATRLLKDAWFKVVAHMMPNLPESTPELDISSFNRVVEDNDFRPDELKIYPVIVTAHSELETLWKEGKFKPYPDATLINLMATIQEKVPETMRINRIHRDIPSSEILAGCRIANLRQVVETTMRKNGKNPRDISAREIRAKTNDPENVIIDIVEYEASHGKEYFIQCIDPADRTLFGLLRLRIPSWFFTKEESFVPVLNNAAIIREIHVFGDQLGIGEKSETKSQHRGLGKRLMETAETIVMNHYPTISKIAVTSGVGVREYYKKRGYLLEAEYMVKYLPIS